MTCESCGCDKNKLIKDRLCPECYNEAPQWVRDLVNDKKVKKEEYEKN